MPVILGQAGNWPATTSYGLAHFGKSLFWYSSEILFAYYLTESLGLRPLQMGWVLAAGFVLSAAADLVLGPAMQRHLGTAGAAGRAQLGGSMLCSAALLLFFAGIWVPEDLRFAYAILTGIAFRFTYAVYDIPQNALMSLATSDSAARARVASTRIWFSGTATLVVAAAVGPLVARRDNPDGAALFLYLAAAFAVVAVASAAWLAHRLGRGASARPPAHQPCDQGAARFSPQFVTLIGVMFVTSMLTPFFAKIEPYYAAFSLRSSWWGGAIIIAMAVGIVAGQPLWMVLCRRLPPGTVMIRAAVLQLLALAVFAMVATTLPLVGAVAAFGFGLGNGGVGMVQWTAFSEAAARRGSGRIGLSYGLFTATAKIALAVGGILLGVALGEVDFRREGSGMLTLLMTAVPALGALLCILLGYALAFARPSYRPFRA